MITVKSQTEIDAIRRAGEVLANALEKIRLEVKPGVTTLELDRIAEEYIRKHKGIPSFKGYGSHIPGAPDFPASICASVNNEVIHGIPGLKTLKDGDIISVDVGVYLNGYHADAARTFPVGQVSEKAERLIDITKKSFFEGIRYAVSGGRIGDISASIQEFVEAQGYSVVRDFVGHGIGREMHEEPQIPNYGIRNRGPRLQSGMTLAIEPMVNEGDYFVKLLDNKWTVVTADESLSAHYENTIAVTDNDPIILTMLS